MRAFLFILFFLQLSFSAKNEGNDDSYFVTLPSGDIPIDSALLSTISQGKPKSDPMLSDTLSLGRKDTTKTLSDTIKDTLPKLLITADSAVIMSPPPLRVLEKTKTTYEISPKCPVDSAVLFVRYFPFKTETLAVKRTPPFSAEWNYKHIPDQDQTQLQFGYVLYHKDGDTIKSPPLPHRWVIDRTRKESKKTYNCHEVPVFDSISIDGRFDDWPNLGAMFVGPNAKIRCTWTSAFFYVAVSVTDTNITPGDRIELMFDLLKSRDSFAGVEHRIISVGPRQRRFTWAVSLHDTASVQVDSILVRTGNEMEWRARETEGGYSIECKIPFVILADVEFPPREFGFDVAVIDASGAGKSGRRDIYSWTKTHPASRHNPSRWGTIKLKQVWLPLKVTLAGLVVIASIAIMGILWLVFYKIRQDTVEMQKTQKGFSPLGEKILETIHSMLDDPQLDIRKISKKLSSTEPEIRATVEKDFGCDFDTLVCGQRIKQARILLRDTDKPLDSIAVETGFRSQKEFSQIFDKLAGISPQEYRQIKLNEKLEQEQEELEEES